MLCVGIERLSQVLLRGAQEMDHRITESQDGMEGVEGTSEHHPVQPPHAMGMNILHEIRVLKATSIYKDILTRVFHMERTL